MGKDIEKREGMEKACLFHSLSSLTYSFWDSRSRFVVKIVFGSLLLFISFSYLFLFVFSLLFLLVGCVGVVKRKSPHI